MKWILLLLLAVGPRPGSNSAVLTEKNLSGRAVKITDGDTFVLLDSGNRQYRIRLNGIDAPEKGQDYYQVSRDLLGSILNKKNIRIRFSKKDRYGRILGDVYVNGNDWVNLDMVKSGLAWHFKKYSTDKVLADAERLARQNRSGLWKIFHPVSPWDFRKGKGEREKGKT